jgi:hypothetical protein
MDWIWLNLHPKWDISWMLNDTEIWDFLWPNLARITQKPSENTKITLRRTQLVRKVHWHMRNGFFFANGHSKTDTLSALHYYAALIHNTNILALFLLTVLYKRQQHIVLVIYIWKHIFTQVDWLFSPNLHPEGTMLLLACSPPMLHRGLPYLARFTSKRSYNAQNGLPGSRLVGKTYLHI